LPPILSCLHDLLHCTNSIRIQVQLDEISMQTPLHPHPTRVYSTLPHLHEVLHCAWQQQRLLVGLVLGAANLGQQLVGPDAGRGSEAQSRQQLATQALSDDGTCNAAQRGASSSSGSGNVGNLV
jgi:hypothetical protein